MPRSVCRVIVGLSSIFVSISLCCKSPATRLPSADPIPSARSAVDPPSLTSDSSPGREGGSEEGTSTLELLFLQGQKAPDPAVASHSSHPQRTPTYPHKHDTQPGCHQEECCGFCTLYLVQLNVAPGLGATWSWEEECRGHQAPLSPGLIGHSWLGTQHFKCCFLSVGPHLQFPHSPDDFP